MADWTGEIDSFMYTYILVILLVFVGIYYTIRTKAVQIRYIKDMFTQLTEKKHVQGEKSISSFQALMVSTASRVGTGNIAGIATAVATGGPGAIFWMWLMALIGAASAFIESTLAQIYKIRGKEGEFRGGPAYYIEQALGKRWLGILFAVLLILCFAFGFNGLQAFNAASSLEYYIPDYATNGTAVGVGIVLIVFTAFVIFGGAKRISIITSIIVPIMAIAYILIALWTTITNIGELPAVFATIFQSAFNFQSIAGGFAGSVVMLGIKRGNAKYGYSMYEFQVFGYQPQNPKPVTSIRLSQNTLSLLEGWSCALTATTQPSSNVYSLKWTSSDPAIVKVDNNGLVTAIGSSGTAMITVESVLDPTVKDTCEVTITPYAGRPTKVSNVKIVNEPTGLLKKGQDWSLAANVLPAGASNRNVNWSSSDPTVAAIDANGVVHAVSAGRAVIRATSVSAPAIFAEITVEVGHTVRFESAETVQIEEQLVADGAYAVKPEDPTRAGYRFEGWYRDTEASEAFDFTQPIHADTVIYLKWTSLPQDVPAVPAENPSMDLGLILGIINGGSGMSFSDVTSSDWFFEDIAAAYQLGLMNGVSTYEFAPKAPLSRAMVAAMLYRMAGSPAAYYGGRQFTDGADGKWYSSVIRWASQMGIVTGFQDGSFRPNENVTRVQLAAMLFRFAQYQSRDIQGRGDLNSYQDSSSVQAWAKEAIQWAVAKGLISGKSGARLDPSGSATRAEAAAVLVRFLRQS